MIESYNFGSITIDGQTYTSDVIIFPDHVNSSWWRKDGHSLVPEDLKGIMDADPEVLIIGCGKSGVLTVPQGTKEYIESQGIELIAKKTDEACKEYNRLANEKRVVAGLHLTC